MKKYIINIYTLIINTIYHNHNRTTSLYADSNCNTVRL